MDSNTIYAINGKTNTVVVIFPLVGHQLTLLLIQLLNLVYVSSLDSDSISIINGGALMGG